MEGNWAVSIMNIIDKITKFIIVNLLWFLFTGIGLVVFGMAPATAATFSLVKKLINNEEINNVFTEFWTVYKDSFFKSNTAGIIFIIVGLFLFVDMRILMSTNSIIGEIALVLIFLMLIIYLITLLYFFPIFTRYEMKLMDYIKLSLTIGMTHPLNTVLILLWGGVVYILCVQFSVLIPLCSITLLCLGVHWLSQKSLDKKVQ